MCNEGELLERFNIQLAPVPMPELTDEMRRVKEEKTEAAEVMRDCREHLDICIKDEELENVAALKVAMMHLVQKYGCQAAAIQCWNQDVYKRQLLICTFSVLSSLKYSAFHTL